MECKTVIKTEDIYLTGLGLDPDSVELTVKFSVDVVFKEWGIKCIDVVVLGCELLVEDVLIIIGDDWKVNSTANFGEYGGLTFSEASVYLDKKIIELS